MIKFVTGNLLDAKVDALVNTVNTAGVMGKGLALQFKKAFPANSKAYEAACKRGEVQIGKMFVFDAGGIVLPRYIINFPTKKHWRSPSKLDYVEEGLRDLIEVIRDRKIRSIAIPPLGAGLGGLDWKEVRAALDRALAILSDIEVLIFAPNGAPPAEAMRNETAKPKMTASRAAVLSLMRRYLVPGYDYRLLYSKCRSSRTSSRSPGSPSDSTTSHTTTVRTLTTFGTFFTTSKVTMFVDSATGRTSPRRPSN